MKKIMAVLGILFLLGGISAKARADGFDFGGKVISTFSDVATGASQSGTPVMLASGTIRFIATVISSGASNGSITIYRTTSSVFTADISTQIRYSCGFLTTNTNPNPIDMFGMENDSYTFIQRIGACEATLFFTFPDYTRSNPVGYIVDCPTCTTNSPVSPNNVGLPYNGQR